MRRLVLVLALAQMGSVMAAQRGAKELRLGYFPSLTHGQALYARVTGEFEREIGVPIRWTAFTAGPTAVESLFANAVDATFIGPSPTINGYVKSRGEKFVIVAGSASGGAGLVVRTDSGIRSEKDFGGKTIATPQLGNTQDVAARLWLAEKGYRLRERGGNVSLVPLSNPDQLSMFTKKQIDGVWTVEPWLSRIEMEGGGRVLLEEKSLWPGGRYVTTHLVVNRTFLAGNQDLMRKLIAALVEVTKRINSDKTAAAALLNGQIKKETSKALRDEVMQKAMARVEFTWDPICSSLKRSAEASHRVGFIRKEPVLNGIYQLALLQEVLKEKHLPAVEGPAP
ncbi:MAG TPA: ABC transporter substrate-binding protein [Dongiaceae bacterium]|nr:ABC transporter substrate-binding protein [Dongiaceae bacterium]